MKFDTSFMGFSVRDRISCYRMSVRTCILCVRMFEIKIQSHTELFKLPVSFIVQLTIIIFIPIIDLHLSISNGFV